MRSGSPASSQFSVLVLATLALASGCSDEPELLRTAVERAKGGNATPMLAGDATESDARDSIAPDTSPGDTSSPDTLPADTTSDTRSDTTAPDTTSDTGPTDTVSPGESVDLVVPATLAIPWVAAGAGASTLAVDIPNLGGYANLALTVLDAPDIHVQGAPVSLAAGQSLSFALRFDGAPMPTIRTGRLRIDATPQGTSPTTVRYETTVHAVAGAPLPVTTWTALSTASTAYGRTTDVRLATAPFPDTSGTWTDDRVNLFVPTDLIDRGPVHYVVHFHGHGTTLGATLPYHRYREQLWASGVNAVLVTPQGPVNAASGNFGKLMRPGNLEALLRDVTSILYRDGIVQTPLVGDVTLTEHSGGYQAVALNLDAVFDEGLVMGAHLFDGLYGYSSAYEAFARAGGYLRSNHTSGGGTRTNNNALLATLGNLATTAPTDANLRDRTAVIWPTVASHNDSTWWQQVFSETLRWAALSARRGPRIELRSAIADAGTATITWLAPDDTWTTAHLVETSPDGETWTVAARVDPHIQRATLPLPGDTGVHVRIASEVEDVPTNLTLRSRSGYVHNGAPILVVDGFDRIFGGSWTDLRHDHAARIAFQAQAATASNEAVVEGEVDLTDFPVVIWFVGDESVADQTFTADEQAVATAYLNAGGGLIVSGAEVAYELRTSGSTFLSRLGAVYSADDSNQNTAKGVGPLASVASFSFGTSSAPYIEDYPDILSAATGATIILRYGNESVAGVGRTGSSALIGFAIETIESDMALRSLIEALVDFVAP